MASWDMCRPWRGLKPRYAGFPAAYAAGYKSFAPSSGAGSPISVLRSAMDYSLTKFSKIFSPTAWLFSGWNCVAKMLSFQTDEA